MPFVVFCIDPLDAASPDATFAAEAQNARQLGLDLLLIDHDALSTGDIKRAMRRIRLSTEGQAVYRGWMLHAEAYLALFEALAERGIHLITTPQAYTSGHHLPEAHKYVGRWMPDTAVLPSTDIDNPDAFFAALAPFGDDAVTVKDWVKSQAAGYWSEACLIPNASNLDVAKRVTERFRELQGDDLVGGLVFRRLIDLRQAEDGAVEWRAFCLDNQVIGCWARYKGAGFGAPPPHLLRDIAQALPSPFFTADLALGEDGAWWLMETGDGQVSGFPDKAAEPVMAALAGQLVRMRETI
jgi:hypothetical protein